MDITIMCDFCDDLRNVEPARYISMSDGNDPDWLKEAKEKHWMLYHWYENDEYHFVHIWKCPYCGRDLSDDRGYD